jgi:hypothetical protein
MAERDTREEGQIPEFGPKANQRTSRTTFAISGAFIYKIIWTETAHCIVVEAKRI